MKKTNHNQALDQPGVSLDLKKPFGITLLLSLLFIILFMVSSELLLRTKPVQEILPLPSVGSPNRSLDIKVHLLERLARDEGPPNIIFLGSSLANAAFDPTTFQVAFKKTTGKEIRCFNFGVNALTMTAGTKLANILVDLYNPEMIIWGVTPLDLSPRNKKKQLIIEQNHWVRYRNGEDNFAGWLADVSYSYRYFLRFRFWMEFPKLSFQRSRVVSKTTAYGFRINRTRNIIDNPVPPKRIDHHRRIMANVSPKPGPLAQLQKALAKHKSTAFILLDMPHHATLMKFYKKGPQTHQQIMGKIQSTARQQGAYYQEAPPPQLLEDRDWYDLTHLNHRGATKFSRWLGKKIGDAVNNKMLPEPGNREDIR